tara:strand:- start:82 stop:294 length:213 start_codon:yes stop_codon:yes gene_type:complete
MELIDEIKPTTPMELSKSQNIRLIDVFVIAPFLFYVGYKAKGLKDWERLGIYVIAGATLIYNGRNYLANE